VFDIGAPGIEVTEWTADQKDDSGQVVLAMILSSRLLARQFDIIVVDEAHHIAMDSYRNKREEIIHEFLLGLTASPKRLDKRNLGFDSIAAQYTVMDLVEQGYLAKPVYVRITTGQNFRMRKQAGDFSSKSLRQLDNMTRNNIVADTWAEDRERWGKTLVFACNIEHAENLRMLIRQRAEALGVHGRMVEVVHSKIPAKVRQSRVDAFRDGRIQVMVNVGVFTEGFDCPDIRTIFMARPTASEVLYLQMVGRGTRRTPTKDSFYVVDLADELGKYSLLAMQWAVDFLGAEDKIAEAEVQQDMADARQMMRDAGIPAQEVYVIMKEFILFAGIFKYETKFSRGQQAVAATQDLWKSWVKFKKLFRANKKGDIRTLINSSYVLTGASESGIDFKKWRDMCWATFFDLTNHRSKGKIKFTPFKATEVDDKLLQDEITKAMEQSDKLNAMLQDQAVLDELQDQINKEIWTECGLTGFVERVDYNDQVVSVYTSFRRECAYAPVRGHIRATIIEVVSEFLDADVQLLLHWAKGPVV
jgi:hypothetical protein